MNGKERVLATLNRQPVDRTPLDCQLYQRQFVEMLAAEYGTREQFLDEFNIDLFVGFTPYPNQLGYKVQVTDLATADLGDARDPKWINFDAWNPDFAGINVVKAVEQHGSKRAIIAHLWGIVEGTSTFLGIESCWANLALEPELMTNWFDRYADWLCAEADSCIDAGVDIITLSDDWGSNQKLLFSPRMWRKLIKPYTMRVAKHVRSRGKHINLHSDGYILDVIDDILEMGFTSLHPVQESAGMDPQKMKTDYGDKIVMYGSLDVVDGLYGRDGEVLDKYIRDRFAVYAPGGGFIFTTGHFVQPDIPPARLQRAYRLANELAARNGSF